MFLHPGLVYEIQTVQDLKGVLLLSEPIHFTEKKGLGQRKSHLLGLLNVSRGWTSIGSHSRFYDVQELVEMMVA